MRLAILSDVESEINGRVYTWAYGRRAMALERWAPDDVEVLRFSDATVDWCAAANCEVVFALDYMMLSATRAQLRKRRFKGVLVGSFNKDSRSRKGMARDALQHCDWLIFNCRERWEAEGRPDRTCSIHNGVDTAEFYPTEHPSDRENRVLYAGGVGPAKQKGWDEVLIPLESRGLMTDFRRVTKIDPSQVLPMPELRHWYNSGSVYLCAAATEGGGPSGLMEAAACGCVPVAMEVGGVPEWIEHDVNGVIVTERTPDAFEEAIRYAFDNKVRLVQQGLKRIKRFCYSRHARWWFALFNQLAAGRDVQPFCYEA
jgi:hypothetical protein